MEEFSEMAKSPTTREIFELKRQGRREEAYEAARQLYAVDKGPSASAAMFWTAVDVFRLRANEGRLDEAEKILLALERLCPTVPDSDGRVANVMSNCRERFDKWKACQYRLEEERGEHLQKGTWGEELAAAYLREKGYVILERDWHSGHRDIDIIALQDDVVVFVEVKTRRNDDYGTAAEAVDFHKQKNLMGAINHYVKLKHVGSFWRFDVIAIYGTDGHDYEIEHIEDFQLNYR